jgi:DNA-entry nuclease
MDADTESLQVPFVSEDDGKTELDTEKCVTESKEPKLKKTDRVPKNEATVIGKEKNHSEAESSVAIEETETEAGKNAAVVEPSDESITLTDIPEYSGNAYVEINDNVPFFTDAEMTISSYEFYSDLDSFGRCGVCVASIGTDLMPTEERGTIGDVKPTGWHTIKYTGIVDGNYLYNRCHLIAYELTGENANVKNLITERHASI